MVPITATKKFSSWLTENPNFYDDRIETGAIDEVTVASIADWFGLRTLCDDENFNIFYGRQLDLVLPRYNKLIRLENTEFDAMVNAYRERQTVDNNSETSSETAGKTKTNAETGTVDREVVRTPDLTTTDNGSTTGTSQSVTSGTNEGTTEGENTTQGFNASVGKQNPQSISYQSGFDSDGMPLLNWSYPSTQSQTKNRTTGTNSGTSTGSNESETEGTESGTSSNTNILTGVETTTEETTNSKNGTIEEEGSIDRNRASLGTTREQWTGRDGLTPQDALRSAMSYVKVSSAFEWLKEQLAVCFLSVYDI